MKNKFFILVIVILSLLLILFFTRLILPAQIDDISPEIPCEKKYLEKAEILWVIPNYNKKPISENQEWCEQILSMNKTLGLHGIQHLYNEFGSEIFQEEFQEAIKIFEECFSQTPEMFKPPQLKISEGNKELIEQNNLKLKLNFNQLTHKVYHCGDTGMFPNWFISYF